MKKVKKFLSWAGGIIAGLVIILLLVGGLGVIMSAGQTGMDKVTSQAYAEGQYDGINGTTNYKLLVSDPSNDLEKSKKEAYAEGHDDAVAGDIRIKSVTDSTFIWTKSPWDDKKTAPSDTIKIIRKKK